MKKIFLTLAVLTSFVGAAQAQLNARSKVTFGFKAGGTASSFKGESTANERFTYGFHAGLAWKVATTKVFSFHPELLYSMKGSENIIEPKTTTRLTYIDVPVTVRASNKSGAFLEAGLQGGVLLSAKANADGEKTDKKDDYSLIDFGYIGGLGFQPRNGGLGGGVRYNASITYATKETISPVTHTLFQRGFGNSAFQVYLAYMFH
jgi:hypothetical protein